jgi:putative copper export protein
MVDEVIEAAWRGWPVAAVVVFGLTMWRLRRRRARSRIGAALSFSAAASVTILILALSGMFRDGLAPGLVPSTGMTALRRTAYGFPLLGVVVPLLVLGWWASRAPAPRSNPGAG